MNQSFSGDFKKQYKVFSAEKYLENKALFDDVSCQNCFEISSKMKQCDNCQRVYCNDCMNTRLSPPKNCPACESSEESLLSNQRLMTLNQIFFKCQYCINGCATTLNAESLQSHEAVCPFSLEKRMNLNNNSAVSCQLSTQLQSLQVSAHNYEEKVVRSTPNKNNNNNNSQSYSPISNSQTKIEYFQGNEYVSLQAFTQLQNEVKLLQQLCAANFKNNCNNGHPLKYEPRDAQITSKVICDVCKREPTVQSVGSYRCAACDFDRCEQCYLSNRIF